MPIKAAQAAINKSRDDVVRARHPSRAGATGWITANCPKGCGKFRTVAKARVPSACVTTKTPARSPKIVKGCAGPSTSFNVSGRFMPSGRPPRIRPSLSVKMIKAFLRKVRCGIARSKAFCAKSAGASPFVPRSPMRVNSDAASEARRSTSPSASLNASWRDVMVCK